MYGVSPAYMISRYNGFFGPADYIREAEDLRSAGFSSMQLEIYDRAYVTAWRNAAGFYADFLIRGMKATVFVAHYLGEELSRSENPDALIHTEYPLIRAVLDNLPDVNTLVIPLMPVDGVDGAVSVAARHIRPMVELAGRCAKDGYRLALEVVPGSAGHSYEKLHEMAGDCRDMSICLDTGHANAAGSDFEAIFRLWEGRISCVHLCDNDGVNNDSLAPGEGNIEWPGILNGLEINGYRGSLDIEIICPPDERLLKYIGAREALRAAAGARPAGRFI